MISNTWIEKRSIYWDRLASLMASVDANGMAALSHSELREMAFLYRQVAADLSAIRQDTTARARTGQLNALLSRAHAVIYSGKKNSWRAVFHFLRSYPVLFRKLLPFVLASLILFLGGALLGALLTTVRPAFMRALLGPAMVQTIEQQQMWTESVNSMAPQASSFITTNNIGVTFATFAGGILAGLGTIYLIFWNGIEIGVVGAACSQHHMSIKLWSFVAPHGSLELPAIVIAGAAGLRLGYGLLFPGFYSRRYSVTLAGSEAVQLLAGTIPMLLCAGTLEGFFSPSHAPVTLKFLVGGIMFSLLTTWLFALTGNSNTAISSPALSLPDNDSAPRSSFPAA
jgi:uncharacterized membrane protein SpoIIM required for sporulation